MNKRRIISLVLSVLMLFGALSLSACEKTKELTEEQLQLMEAVNKASSGYYRSLLTDEKDIALYDEILTAVITHDKEYVIKHSNSDTVNRIALYITLDNPFVTLSDNLIEYRMTHDYDSDFIDYFTEFDLPFSLNYEDKSEDILESIKKAEEIIAAMPQYDDEYLTARYFHDYLAANVSYSSDENTTIDHCTPYAALIGGSGKCESYSRSFALLCNMAGIDCFMVMYDQSQSEDGVGHMWNMVKINGNYYYVDVTHDSFTKDIGYPDNYVAYDYFLTNAQGLSRPDLISEKIASVIPAVESDEDNFFVKSGLVFSSYNRNTVGKAAGAFLKAQKDEGYSGVSIRFENKPHYDKALKKSELQKLLYVISRNDGYGAKTYNYGTNEKQLIIRIHPKS